MLGTAFASRNLPCDSLLSENAAATSQGRVKYLNDISPGFTVSRGGIRRGWLINRVLSSSNWQSSNNHLEAPPVNPELILCVTEPPLLPPTVPNSSSSSSSRSSSSSTSSTSTYYHYQ
uniref:Uncharacterized protein n=1 Tax=Vespula pensylvanica TaxID=30213 RepID=A0A834KGJ7_VESPE|nr:hypothetical protein H0235_015108 [Vespula pensylvanica]